MTSNVLVVEDEAALASLLRYNLEAEGFSVTLASCGEQAEQLIAKNHFDLIVLDWVLPGVSGLEVCRRLRHNAPTRTLPLLMLTARGEETDRVRGLGVGADDYVVKPFSVVELMARVRSLLRRAAAGHLGDVLTSDNIVLDRDAHRVKRGSREVRLGPTEYRLLEAFMESSGRVLSRGQLLDRVWRQASDVNERTVDVHVGRLRKALIDSCDTDPIRTVRGAGYVFCERPDGVA
jgi:two-component system, OmpR family, phosphate regulon response regulator PhoB